MAIGYNETPKGFELGFEKTEDYAEFITAVEGRISASPMLRSLRTNTSALFWNTSRPSRTRHRRRSCAQASSVPDTNRPVGGMMAGIHWLIANASPRAKPARAAITEVSALSGFAPLIALGDISTLRSEGHFYLVATNYV